MLNSVEFGSAEGSASDASQRYVAGVGECECLSLERRVSHARAAVPKLCDVGVKLARSPPPRLFREGHRRTAHGDVGCDGCRSGREVTPVRR